MAPFNPADRSSATVPRQTTLDAAANVLMLHDCQHLTVVDEAGTPAGQVNLRQLMRAMVTPADGGD